MTISLYEALVPNWIQILEAISMLVDKAEAHCVTHEVEPAALIGTRLWPDMYPLGYQFKSAVTHSFGALEALRIGRFTPDRSPWSMTFEGFRNAALSAVARLSVLDPAEVEELSSRVVHFEAGVYKTEFEGRNFLLSFSQPNFFFHCTAAYAILRAQGVAIGKRDFLGRMRTS